MNEAIFITVAAAAANVGGFIAGHGQGRPLWSTSWQQSQRVVLIENGSY